MNMARLLNPVFSEKKIKKVHQEEFVEPLTAQGAANKTILLSALLLVSGAVSFVFASPLFYLLTIGLVFIGVILSIVTIVSPKKAVFTAPAYAVVEGLVVGTISRVFASTYNGIVLDAIIMTTAILFISLFCFKTGLIKVTRKFRIVVLTATAGIAVVYLLDIVLGLFHYHVPLLNDTGLTGILVSVAIVLIASLNFFIDFQNIIDAEKYGVPKYMEWYFGFGIILTLVWLYLEVLRLLSRARK